MKRVLMPLTRIASALRTFVRQFTFTTAFRLMLAESARKLLDPYCITSYSQTGEDRIIDFYLGAARSGFYVDIGCHRPFALSNTMRLYKRGWHGLCVDGNPELIKEFRRCRPSDTCVCACVSNVEESVVFTIPQRPELASLGPSSIDDISLLNQARVRTVTGQSLLETYDVPRNFELLSIDVEGFDLAVLQSIDLHRFRPQLIVVEMHRRNMCELNAKEDAVVAHLEGVGYCLAAYSTMNGYFIRAGD